MRTTPLVEFLAERVHEAWMADNIAQGILVRESPRTGADQMVPYDRLSDIDQEVDRATVRAVLVAITEGGYLIVPADSKQISR